MRTYLTRLAAGTLLLFLALFGGLYSLFGPFSLTADAAALLPFCLLAALVGAAVHALPDGKWHTLAALGICAALFGVLWLYGSDLVSGGQVLFHQISLGYHQQLPKILFFELPERLLYAGAPVLARLSTRFLAFVLFPVSLWLGQWLLRGWPVWPGLAAACALPGLGLFILRQPHPLPLGAFLLFLALAILSRRGYQEDPCLGSRRVLIALLPLALTMTLLSAVLPQEGYTRSPWVEGLRQSFKHMDLPLPGWAVSGNSNAPGAQPFPRFGPPRFDGHTVLTVEVQGEPLQGPVLLRGFSAGSYTSSGWQPSVEPGENAGLSFIFPAWASGVDESGLWSLSITDVGTSSAYYYRPYFPLSSPYEVAKLSDAYLTRPSGTDRYQVSYLPSDAVPAGATLTDEDLAREEAYRRWVYETYLDLPYDLLTPEAVQIIRQGAAQASEGDAHSYVDLRAAIIARAEAVADYLASFTQYDLFASSAPLGQDTISYFLTTGHRGYCTHYATAATLILREMGLPTRFTAGYSVDLAGKQGPVDVPDQNAHAWVEVYVDGFGWQPVDVTPPSYPGSGAQTTAAPSRAPASSAPSSTPAPGAGASATPAPSAQPSLSPGGSDGPAPGRGSALLPALLGVLALCLLAGTVLLQRRLRLRRRHRECTQPDNNAAVLALYSYLIAAQRRCGTPLPTEALDLAKKAAFSQHILRVEERRAMESFARQTKQALSATPWPRRLLSRYLWALC